MVKKLFGFSLSALILLDALPAEAMRRNNFSYQPESSTQIRLRKKLEHKQNKEALEKPTFVSVPGTLDYDSIALTSCPKLQKLKRVTYLYNEIKQEKHIELNSS